MITWNDPDERYYEHGLDRGVLYPSGLPQGAIVEVNYVYNPNGGANSIYGWSPYGAGTSIQYATLNGKPAFNIYKTVAGSQLGFRTNSIVSGTKGMQARGAGAQVTISAEVRNLAGQAITTIGFIARDDTNSDSAVLGSIVAGAMNSTVPADGEWHQIYVTGTVVAGRTLEAIYVQKAGTPLITESLQVRNVMVNDGALVPFFKGDSIPDSFEYEWTGVPYQSTSAARPVPADRAIGWDGLVSFDEGEAGASTVYYRDGVIYLADVDASDFSGKLTTMFFPRKFSECLGFPEATDGLFVDNQKPKRFDFCYRSLIGSGSRGDMFGYQLHLVYNAMASVGTKQRKTIGSDVSPVSFDFDLVCTPVKLPGFRPTAHFVIDTRGMSPNVLAQIETILYGTSTIPGRMPTPGELYDLMNFGDAITVTVHANHNIGSVYPVSIKTYTVEGSQANVYEISPLHFKVDNANVTATTATTWTVSDGGTTDVIIE